MYTSHFGWFQNLTSIFFPWSIKESNSSEKFKKKNHLLEMKKIKTNAEQYDMIEL